MCEDTVVFGDRDAGEAEEWSVGWRSVAAKCLKV